MILSMRFDFETEKDEAFRAIQGADYYAIVTRVDEWARGCLRHGTDRNAQQVLTELRRIIGDEMSELAVVR